MDFLLSILDSLLVLILFIFVFGLLVFVHELGHFLAARLTGTKVIEFAIGFGPLLFARKRGDTNWVIRAIPFGGYCQIEGQEETKNTPDSYSKKNYLQKLLILAGGVIMNYLLSVIIFYFLVGLLSGFSAVFPKINDIDYVFGKQEKFYTYGTKFSKVLEGSPAAKAALEKGGTVKTVGGKEVYTSEDLTTQLSKYKSKEVMLEVTYVDGGVNDRKVEYKVTPDNTGKIGIELERTEAYLVNYQGLEKVFVGFTHTINLLQFQIEGIGSLISQSRTEGTITPVAKNVSSPVGIFVGIRAFFSVGGLLGILSLIGLLSLALAFFNILPFPALDGGHIVIVTIEKLTGRQIDQRIQNAIAFVGFAILIILMLLVTVKDLIQFGVFDIF